MALNLKSVYKTLFWLPPNPRRTPSAWTVRKAGWIKAGTRGTLKRNMELLAVPVLLEGPDFNLTPPRYNVPGKPGGSEKRLR